MKNILKTSLFLIAAAALLMPATLRAQEQKDNDQTLRAMKDEMARAKDRLELKISDDGIGISGVRNPAGGMGLHIMNYRARTIGGVLNIGFAGQGRLLV